MRIWNIQWMLCFIRALIKALSVVVCVLAAGASLKATNLQKTAHSRAEATGSPVEAGADVELLSREIITRLQRVPEFRALQQLALKHNINKVYLFGGTAAAWAHYVRWSLEYENQQHLKNTATDNSHTNTTDTSAVDPSFAGTSAVDASAADTSVAGTSAIDTSLTNARSVGIKGKALSSRRFNSNILDYNLGSIVRSNQDVDIVVDHPDNAAVVAFQNDINRLNAELNRKVYELRGLHHDYGGKSALASSDDFLKQNTDSMSTTLIELYSALPKTQTEKKGYENFVASSALGETNRAIENRSSRVSQLTTPTNEPGRNYRDKFIDLRHPGSKLSGSNQFLIDVAAGHISCYYDDTKHKTTTRYKEGSNPDIFFAIRVLNKVFQYDLSLNADCYQTLKSIFANFTEKDVTTSYTQYWLNKNAPKLYQNAMNLEKAHAILTDLGALEKLQAMGNGYQQVVNLMKRQPLLSKPLDQQAPFEQNPLAAQTPVSKAVDNTNKGKTAGELGIEYVTHYTKSAHDYESITSSPTLQANVLVSREGQTTLGETAVFGDGFYTFQGFHMRRSNFGDSLWPVWFYVDPRAREGVDFKRVTSAVLLFQNKAALQMIGDTSEYDVPFNTLQFFQLWAQPQTNQLQTNQLQTNQSQANPAISPVTGREDKNAEPSSDGKTQQASVFENLMVQFISTPQNRPPALQDIDNMKKSVLQSRLRRQIRVDLQKHPEKRRALKAMANDLLHQYMQQEHSLIAKVKHTLISKNPVFWSMYFELPFDDLDLHFLTYIEHLAQTPDTGSFNYSHRQLQQTMHRKMYEYFQARPQQRDKLMQLAHHQLQQPLSFLKNQMFWRVYVNLGLSLEGFDPVIYFQDLADWYLQQEKQPIQQSKKHQNQKEEFFLKEEPDREDLPYLHIDIESFLLQQIINKPAQENRLYEIATQLIQQLPNLRQAPVFWLTYLRLPSSTRPPGQVDADSLNLPEDLQFRSDCLRWFHTVWPHFVPKEEVSQEKGVDANFARNLHPVLADYPHWSNFFENTAKMAEKVLANPVASESRAVPISPVDLTLQVNLPQVNPAVETNPDEEPPSQFETKVITAIARFLDRWLPAKTTAEAVPLVNTSQSHLPKDKNKQTTVEVVPLFDTVQKPEPPQDKNQQTTRILKKQDLQKKASTQEAQPPLQTLPAPKVESLNKLIQKSVEAKNLNSLQVALALGLDVNFENDDKNSLLSQMLYGGYLEGMRFLLSSGANPNLRHGPGLKTVLMYAVGDRNVKALQILLDSGADPLVQDAYGRTAFDWLISHPKAVKVNSSTRQVIKLLLDVGADVDAENKPHLIRAAVKENYNLIQILLDMGVDPDIRDENENTALMSAVYSNCYKCVEVLLAAGAKPNLKDEIGRTALTWLNLHWGIKDGDPKYENAKKIIKILLDYGAYLELEDKYERLTLSQKIMMSKREHAFLKSVVQEHSQSKYQNINSTIDCVQLLQPQSS